MSDRPVVHGFPVWKMKKSNRERRLSEKLEYLNKLADPGEQLP